MILLLKYWRGLAFGLLVLAFIGVSLTLSHELNKERAARLAQQVASERAIAAQQGAQEGKKVNTIVIKVPVLTKFVKDEEKAGAKAVQAHETTVTLSDTAKGTATAQSVEDEYGRFRFDLPSGVLTRKQKFTLSSVIVRSADGKYRFEKKDFREYSPKYGTEIPTEGAEIEGNFQFVDEPQAAVKPVHLRLVFAVDHRAAVGAGLELLNFKDRANLSVIGYYDRVTRKAEGAIQLGYRVGKTNFSIGPYYSTRRAFGLGVTLEVTR